MKSNPAGTCSFVTWSSCPESDAIGSRRWLSPLWSDVRRQCILERHGLRKHAARFIAGRPADERADGEVLRGFERHFPPDLQRVRRMKPEAVARQVGELGLELAGLAMHPDRQIGVDSGVPGEELLAG